MINRNALAVLTKSSSREIKITFKTLFRVAASTGGAMLPKVENQVGKAKMARSGGK